MRIEMNGMVIEGTVEELREIGVKFPVDEEAKFKVGDYARVIEPGYCGDIEVGSIVKITDPKDDDGHYRAELLDGSDYDWFADDQLEKVTVEVAEQAKAKTQPKFEVGDYVVALPESDGEYGITNTDMKLGKVTHVYSDGEIKVKVIAHVDDDEVGGQYVVDSKYFRKATDEEVAQAKAKTQPKFEVGDYARVVENDSCHYANIGDIVKIVEDDKSGMPYRCEDLTGEDVGWFKEHELAPATDEEARWAKIGRKPGEFKKGDIVRITKYESGHAEGSVVEVVDVFDGVLSVKGDSKIGLTSFGASKSCVKLIAPVEQRFDLAAEPKVGARQ